MIIFGGLLHPNSKIHAYEEVCEMGRNHGVDSIGAHLLLSILLYLPPVQNWAVKQVAAYASESTGMDISVKQVRLVFPLKLGVEGVKVLQPIDSLKNSPNLALRNKRDTVADIRKMVVDVQLLPLSKVKSWWMNSISPR